jgi:rhomboid family GlyGly-CTERM serine protease
MVLLWVLGDRARVALRYERFAILAGEYWRLVTGHWVHGDFKHLSLNVLGALLTAALGHRAYTLKEWLVVLAISTVAIDFGFLVFEPRLDWYVGASGVLHGAMAAAAVAWWRIESKLLAATFSAIVVGKLCWEQFEGALPLAGEMNVIIDAHLYGAIGGTLTALVLEAGRAVRRRHPAPL